MKRSNIIITVIVLAAAALVLGVTAWFDGNWNRYEVTGDESPSWQETEDTSSWLEDSASATESGDGQASDKIVAPAFTVYDAEGNPVALSDFLGKPVILNFWASWCGPCKSEMPDFQDKYTEYGEQIHFLMVNLTDGTKETVESASSFISSQGYTFPVYFDTGSEAASAYSIRSIPTSFFIDAEGYAIAQATGAIDAETLQKGIDLILPAPAGEETETDENTALDA